MPIDVDNPRLNPPGLRDGKLEKALSRKSIAVWREQEIDVLPAESIARYRYVHRPATRM